ncbi:MAG: NPCBM/NEW2 domain-containing protein, partial [Bacillota bacterium]|nr:NPCBM/NEW2 domain-containing protein [Bacillota bacterium]
TGKPQVSLDLSDTNWVFASGGTLSIQKNKSVGLNNIRLGNFDYQKGLGVGSNSLITYHINGEYSRFTSFIGIDDEVSNTTGYVNINGIKMKLPKALGSVKFKVFTDGKLIYDSGIMTSNDVTKYIDLDVAGKQILTLAVEDCGDGSLYDHADWANPRLLSGADNSLTCPVSYKKKDGGIFIYCNNPESIKPEDLVDSGKIILEQSGIEGNAQVFLEQINNTGKQIYYAIQLHNPGNGTVTVTVNNKGYSVRGWSGIKQNYNCWMDFSRADRKYSFKIPPGSTGWLLEPAAVKPYTGKSDEGLINSSINFNVQGGSTEIRFCASSSNTPDILKLIDKACYEGYVTRHTSTWGEARMYKGISQNLPDISGNFTWVIDDYDKKGPLPVCYNGNGYSGWATHITLEKLPGAYVNDLFSFTTPKNIMFSPTGTDPSTMKCNLGNWGVTYHDTIKITNKGTLARRIGIALADAVDNTSAIVIKPDGSIIKNGNQKEHFKKITSIVIGPGRTSEYKLDYLIPGSSNGGLMHYVYLEN